MVEPLALGEVVAHMRENLNGGVEQDHAVEPLGRQGRELEHEASSERMPEPGGTPHALSVQGLEHVVGVRRDRPWRLPARRAVAAQVWGKHAEPPGEALFRQLAETARTRSPHGDRPVAGPGDRPIHGG